MSDPTGGPPSFLEKARTLVNSFVDNILLLEPYNPDHVPTDADRYKLVTWESVRAAYRRLHRDGHFLDSSSTLFGKFVDWGYLAMTTPYVVLAATVYLVYFRRVSSFSNFRRASSHLGGAGGTSIGDVLAPGTAAWRMMHAAALRDAHETAQLVRDYGRNGHLAEFVRSAARRHGRDPASVRGAPAAVALSLERSAAEESRLAAEAQLPAAWRRVISSPDRVVPLAGTFESGLVQHADTLAFVSLGSRILPRYAPSAAARGETEAGTEAGTGTGSGAAFSPGLNLALDPRQCTATDAARITDFPVADTSSEPWPVQPTITNDPHDLPSRVGPGAQYLWAESPAAELLFAERHADIAALGVKPPAVMLALGLQHGRIPGLKVPAASTADNVFPLHIPDEADFTMTTSELVYLRWGLRAPFVRKEK
ncbi:hypothetical protein H696_04611 [Fonticula alba]|uniref:Uncharacterized protein n=1 Tax=Fonticula alba TaxID=691883 RepID=A0A058Z4Y5_FONAL|nr:hypothetical protein H696_04611 [Fonticula alba]KCV69201.1 hypothetical protein H696_04611 [Fonticula alba]|eukprot:XP_009496772.1 hypothetical protein H696_04611 [Fonticula alba]